jgi:hypothetical protein
VDGVLERDPREDNGDGGKICLDVPIRGIGAKLAIQVRTADLKPHFRRAKRLAVWLSLVAASDILFLIYGYSEETYRHIPFWEVRVPVFALILIVAFVALWFGSRRGARTESSGKE